MRWIPQREVARRRIVEEFELQAGKGRIVADGRTFAIEQCDDVLDLAQLAESLMLRLTGKMLRPQFRPSVGDRSKLRPCLMRGGDYELGGSEAPLPAVTTCEVTGQPVKTHYVAVEINGNKWESWFGRLDELAKCMYVIVREAQGDKYQAKPSLLIGARGAIPFQAPGVGNA